MRRFPSGFLFGTATSATQVEGSQPDSDWARFAREPGRIKDGAQPDDCGDHWLDFTPQIELAKGLGLNAHRLSIDWARVEPRPGEINARALDRYAAELEAWNAAGIQPMVTLHHFSLPGWLAERGGILADEFPRLIAAYAREVASALGEHVAQWVTINEPGVLATLGYILGQWPPGKRGQLRLGLRAHHKLLEAHTLMYRALKSVTPDVPVGLAHHLRVIEPRDTGSLLDRTCAGLMDRFFNQGLTRPLNTGGFLPGLDQILRGRTGFDAKDARGTQDFFGVNYYSRDLVRFSSAAEDAYVDRRIPRGAEVSDLGWEVHPEGLTDVLRRWHDETGLPMYVTENGIADARDRQRPNFIVRHLIACLDALDTGVDVRGYFHWSLVDNFEWHEGKSGRFGLHARADDGSFEENKSARIYARVIKDGGVGREHRLKYGAPASSARRQRGSAT